MQICKPIALAPLARRAIAICFLAATAFPAFAEDGIDQLISEFNQHLEQDDGTGRLETLRTARDMADRIVSEHPQSDAAFQILTENTLGEVDLSDIDQEIRALYRQELDARLAAVGVTYESIGSSAPVSAEKQPEATPAAMPSENQSPERLESQPRVIEDAPQGPAVADSPEETENDRLPEIIPFEILDEKEIIARTQAALNDLGCNVGTADGVIGRKTRAGHAAFIEKTKLDESRFGLGSVELLQMLEAMNGTVCEKPPVVALTPSSMSGQWSFRARCGPNSRFPNKVFTGGISIAHQGGGTYAGRIRNSQGFNGTIRIRLSGRNAKGLVNWGLLLGKVSFSVSFSDDGRAAYGRDSNRCRMSVRKR